MLFTKLASRKFIVTIITIALIVVSKYQNFEMPWEAVGVSIAYIFGEGAVDIMREVRNKIK